MRTPDQRRPLTFNPNLYARYETGRSAQSIGHKALATTVNLHNSAIRLSERLFPIVTPFTSHLKKHMNATVDLSERAVRDYENQGFGITETYINGDPVAVNEQIVEGQDLPYGSLLHFQRETELQQPPVFIVAPLSGHYATLLRDTVEKLLPNHDVYISDWKNARDVPIEHGDFGLEDYTRYVKNWIEALGPKINVLAVCQSTVPTIAAISRLAEDDSPNQPLTMTMMAGPIDAGAAPTAATELADNKPIEWFENNLLAQVPGSRDSNGQLTYRGAGQIVYPGFMQLTAFMSMNMDRHIKSHLKLYSHIVGGDSDEAEKIQKFYDEYFAVLDMSGRFYIDTVEQVFQDKRLSRGEMQFEDRTVLPKAIGKTALLTVEGANDDISAPGQTTALHAWMSGLAPRSQYHYTDPKAGHYGVFSGNSSWGENIAPRISALTYETARQNGIEYDTPSTHSKLVMPDNYA